MEKQRTRKKTRDIFQGIVVESKVDYFLMNPYLGETLERTEFSVW